MHTAARTVVAAFVILAALHSGACATSARQQRPGRGSVTVGVTTMPVASASLMFRVIIEPAGISGEVKADAGVFTSDDVPLGEHVVRLAGLPGVCRVAGETERKITISEQRRFAVLRFDVRCE